MLPLGNEKLMVELAREVEANGLSVRDVERRVQAGRGRPATSGRPTAMATSPTAPAGGTAESRRIEELLRRKLQTGVSLPLSGKERGEVRIAFFSNDDLERVLAILGISLD